MSPPKPLVPVLDGIIRGPNIFVRIQNPADSPHQFKVVFHGVSGAAGRPRVKDAWLPWNCGDFQLIGPRQSGMIQVAQVDGEDRRIGKVIRFIHDKVRQYDGRLSEYVPFGGALCLDLELQSDALLDIQSRRQWTLEVDASGVPIRFNHGIVPTTLFTERTRNRSMFNLFGQNTRKVTGKVDKQLLYKSQNGKCMYCGRKMDSRYLHVDHKTPVAKRGSDSNSNKQLLCQPCNGRKGSMTDGVFRKLYNLTLARQADGPPSKRIEQNYFDDIKKDLDRAKAKKKREKNRSWF